MFGQQKVASRATRGRTAVFSLAALVAACGPASLASARPSGAATAPLSVTWMASYAAPDTPAQYNKVGVLKVGPSSAKNVLVLEPGTSAGSAYFVPLSKWIVAKTPGWQVWSVERRENLLEDESELNLFKDRRATATELFDYYLGYLKDPDDHAPLRDGPGLDRRIRQGLGDERRRPGPAHRDRSRQEARRQGRPRRALPRWLCRDRLCHLGFQRETWSRPAGGPGVHRRGQRPDTPVPRFERRRRTHDRCAGDPGAPGARCAVGVPLAELRGDRGALRRAVRGHGFRGRAVRSNAPSLGQASGLLPADIVPPVRVSNIGQYGYALERGDLAAGSGGGPGAPRYGPRFRRPDPRVERSGSAHADHAVRRHVLGLGSRQRGRHRVVLPATPDR